MNARISRVGAMALALALTACGGGGGASTVFAPPTSSPSNNASASIHFVIPNGSTPASLHKAHPAFVSSATLSVKIVATNTVNSDALGTVADLSASSSLCTPPGASGRTCTVTAAAFYGQTTFVFTTYNEAPVNDLVPAGAQILGTGSVSADLVAGTPLPAIDVVISAQVGSVGSPTFLSVPADGNLHQPSIMINPTDFGNASLTPIPSATPITYANPITATIAESGGSGNSVLLKNNVAQGVGASVTLNSSSDTVGISYNGGGSSGYYATVTLSAAGATSEVVQMSPMYVGVTPSAYVSGLASAPVLNLGGTTSIATLSVTEAGSPPAGQIYSVTPSGCNTFATTATVSNTPAAASFMVTGGTNPIATGTCTLTVSDGSSLTTYKVSNTTSGSGSISFSGYTFNEFQLPDPPSDVAPEPIGIAVGSDGNIWFADSATNYLESISTTNFPGSPSVSAYVVSGPSSFQEITGGPDGALWATSPAGGSVTRIEPSNTGTPNTFTLPGAAPFGIATNIDGQMYIGEENSDSISQLGLGGGLPFTYTTTGFVTGVARDANGDIFGCENTAKTIVEYVAPLNSNFAAPTTTWPTTADPWLIARDINGNMWFTEQPTAPGGASYIGEINILGHLTEFMLPANSNPVGITAGSDGAIWFVDSANNEIGRIPTSATPASPGFMFFPIPTPLSGASDIVTGPDGNLWFIETTTSKIGRLIP